MFENEKNARTFSEAFGNGTYLPIDTGKHIYTHWTAILEKRGALNPLMDPFLHPANKDFVPDYQSETYPRTLDLLARTAFIWVSPDAMCAWAEMRF